MAIVTQVWGARAGRPPADAQGVSLLLMSVPASVQLDFLKKLISGEATIDFTTVSGHDAYWIRGAHEVLVMAADGVTVLDIRVAGDVLLWSDGGLTYRLESRLGEAASIRLAETVIVPRATP